MTTSTSHLDHHGGGVLPAFRFALLAILAFGLLFPAFNTWLGGLLFPAQASGSLIERNGRIVGSSLAAQAFAADRYFHPRPSASAYDPRAMAGSNLAPSNPALRERIANGSDAVTRREGIKPNQVPADLVTASGSGIDPHISPKAAEIQVPRIARARELDESRVRTLVLAYTQSPTWGVLGQARVNVLELNLALDAETP